MKNLAAQVFLVLGIFFSAQVGAEVIQVEIEVPWPDVRVDHRGFSHLELDGFVNYGPSGAPALPHRTVNVLIPPGHRVLSAQVIVHGRVELPGSHVVFPCQKPWPFRAGPPPFSQPDSLIYNGKDAFPSQSFQLGGIQILRGFAFQPVELTPFRYQSAAGQLSFFPSMTIVLTTESARSGPIPLFRGRARDFAKIRKVVANPDLLKRYQTATPAPRNPDTRYVIVTSQELADCPGPNNLQTLTADKESRGISTHIQTMADIRANYSGADDPEKVRNFILDRYLNHGTDFVLLAGDADLAVVGGETEPPIVPIRGLWGDIDYGGVETNAPSDLYYACLDGDFDANANGIFGEPDDEPDLFAEVATGRLPADNCTEISNFVRKTLAYQAAAGTWLQNVTFAGELLFPDVYAKDYLEHIHYSSDDSSLSTLGFSESSFFEISTMYDADLGDNGWGAQQILDVMNGNVHILNHLGHSYTNYHMRMFTDQLIAGLGAQRAFFQYGQGCYAGSFDNRLGPVGDNNAVISQDCFAEHLLLHEHGTFANVHYTRYGVAGVCNYINRFFWDAAFRLGMTRLGEMHYYSLEQVAGMIADPYLRWMYYVTTLFGDPELSIHLTTNVTDPLLGIPSGPLRFVAVAGASNPPGQVIMVENFGGGTLNWSVGGGDTWLLVQPASGTAPSNVTLSVDASGLTPGEYMTQLTFSAPGVSNSPQTLDVMLNVIAVPAAVAPFSASTPILDGVIDAGEYSDAVVLKMGLDPQNPGSSTARLMHDGTHLYFALEIGAEDTDVDAADAMLALIDNNRDGVWPTAPGLEGMHQIMNGGGNAFVPLYNPGSGMVQGDPVFDPTGMVGVVGNAWPRVVEVSFDLGLSQLQVGPGDTFGMFLFFYDFIQDQEWQQVAYWPWNLGDYNDCSSFGAITIGTVEQNLMASPSSFTFNAAAGGPPAPQRGLTISSTSGAPLSFTLTSGNSWILLSDGGGQTPAIIQVQADPAGISYGPHIGEIQITAAGAGNSPLLVPVTFLVAEQPPAIQIEPASLFFQAERDGPLPDSQTLNISNSGGGQLDWTATGQGAWFDFTPVSGSGTSSISVAPSTTSLTQGTHAGSIEFTASGANMVRVQFSYRISVIECDANAECDDGDPCTSDACLDHSCRSTPIANCCTSTDQCDDKEDCTEDLCTDNRCEHVDTCCQIDADCDDGDECTTDYCGTDQRCKHIDEGLCQTEDPEDEGCGCGTDGRKLPGLLMLLALFAFWRTGPKRRPHKAA
ncbi:MAG: hypothetical protein JRJ87_13550 [Deltaproteobacteria bacterium]|nr:hypothetical protein [Deltaproteobacteria bacterium]